MFLKWIGRAQRQRRIRFPEGNGPVRWSLSYSFFRFSDIDLEEGNPQKTSEERPDIPAEWEDTA